MLLRILIAALGNSVWRCCRALFSSFWILLVLLMAASASCESLRLPVSWYPMLIMMVRMWDVCCLVTPMRSAAGWV